MANEGSTDREAVLDRLDEVIAYAEYKSLGDGRITDAESERLRVKYLTTIVSAANAKRGLLKDRDLDEMDERLRELEENQERAKYR